MIWLFGTSVNFFALKDHIDLQNGLLRGLDEGSMLLSEYRKNMTTRKIYPDCHI